MIYKVLPPVAAHRNAATGGDAQNDTMVLGEEL